MAPVAEEAATAVAVIAAGATISSVEEIATETALQEAGTTAEVEPEEGGYVAAAEGTVVKAGEAVVTATSAKANMAYYQQCRQHQKHQGLS